jgi:hypothetical protein
VSFGGVYFYNQLWPSLAIAAGRSTGLAGGLVIDGRNTAFHDENWGLSATVGLPVVRAPEVFSDVSFSYDVSWERNLDPPIMQDPNNPVPVLPVTGVSAGATFRWSMSDVRGFAYTYGPVEGRGLSLALRLDHPALGADVRAFTAFYRFDQYLAMPLGGQVAAIRLQGAVGASERPGGVRFFLGGAPHQDLVSAVLNSTRADQSWLRGYPAGAISGSQYHLLNFEYRIPVGFIERGVSTLPFYFRRLHLAGLVDVAGAFDAFDAGDLRVAVGGAVRLDMLFGFYVPGSFDIGYARGVSRGGEDEVWLLLTGGI